MKVKLSTLISLVESKTNKKVVLQKQVLEKRVLKEADIDDKDWQRMLDLHLADDREGDKVAKVITNKKKAIARFVAGLKLANKPLKHDPSSRYEPFPGPYSSLGKKALTLGATFDEIKKVFDSTTVPQKFLDKETTLAPKALANSFVARVSKAVLAAGYDIDYLKHNGYALTQYGQDVMSRNGSKWTIGYKTELTVNKEKYTFFFDAITDEGGRTSLYTFHSSNNQIIREHMDRYDYTPAGINEFTKALVKALDKISKVN